MNQQYYAIVREDLYIGITFFFHNFGQQDFLILYAITLGIFVNNPSF